MIDPRTSDDPYLQRALRIWDQSGHSRKSGLDQALLLRQELVSTTNHRAFGWASLTCGRVSAYSDDIERAEAWLSEAAGRFHLIGDVYGMGLADSHIGITYAARRELDAALRFMLNPLASGIRYSDDDLALLHNNAAMCYWQREENHEAIAHLVKEYDLVKKSVQFDRISVVLSNLSVVLLDLGQFELAIAALKKAWQMQLEHRSADERDLGVLSNIVVTTFYLDHLDESLRYAFELEALLKNEKGRQYWATSLYLVDTFATCGECERAQFHYDRARALSIAAETSFWKVMFQIAEAHLVAGRGDHKSAIKLASDILNQPVTAEKKTFRMQAARIQNRSYLALGRKAEAERARLIAEDVFREGLLGSIISNQIRQSLGIAEPTMSLTEKELSCLSLSALGQTSADIGLKLGITPRTVNYHFGKIFRKLNAMNRQEAIAKAVSANLIK